MKEVTNKIDMARMIELCKSKEQIDCPISHDFAEGMYIRKMSVPAGTFVIGHVHKQSTYNIFLKGSATVKVGDKGETKFIKAPMAFVSGAGIRKAALFHEDSEWINCFATKETDIIKLEKELAYDEQELIEGEICP